MKKFIIPIFLFIVSCQTNNTQNIDNDSISTDRVTEIRQKLLNRDKSSVIVVAHRGDWRNFPENSLAAIDNAIKMGVDMVEMDVHKTKDGQLILMHDKTLDRTTTGKGNISDWTLDSIKTLYLKNGCGIKTKHRVPMLEEVLLLAKGKAMVNLDKADVIFDEVFALLEKTGTICQAIMKGSQPPEYVMQHFGKYLDKIIYMPIVKLDEEGDTGQIDEFMKNIHPVAFELLYTSDNNPVPLQVKKNLAGKSLIWYNTLWDTMAGGHDDDLSLEDPDKGYGYLIDTLGARIIQTDRPAYLIEYLRKRDMHK